MVHSPSVVRAFTDCSRAPHEERDYSQMLLLFHSPLFIGYCTMFYVVFVTQLFCLLSRLSGSRVQLNRVIHNRPQRDSHPEASNYVYYTTFKPLLDEDKESKL